MSNYKEFIKLIERYESITLKEIEKAEKKDIVRRWMASNDWGASVANYLTGFGNYSDCTLCKVSKSDCSNCVYIYVTGSMCNLGENWDSYNEIRFAETPKQLLEAFRERARYMRKIIKKEK
jgi:hypothetical protein